MVLDLVFGRVNLVETDYFGLRYCDHSHQTVSHQQTSQQHAALVLEQGQGSESGSGVRVRVRVNIWSLGRT